MNCDSFREQFAEYLAGGLDSGERGNVSAHLESCKPCRSEFERLQEVWNGLDALPCPEPGPGMRPRFLRMLEVYQAGQSSGAAERSLRTTQQGRRWSFWPARPAWQAAFAAGLVLIGILGGRYTSARNPRGGAEVARLQGQVENLRQLVALSLLREQSPSARLRGVTYTYQMAQPDSEVQQALLHAVTLDPNVNVRLSAVDALQKFAASPALRRATADAIAAQDSPLVQAALIDCLIQWNDTGAVPALRRLAQDPRADALVRQRAAAAVQRMEISR